MDTKRPTSAAAEEILGRYFPVLDAGFVSVQASPADSGSPERSAASRGPAPRPSPTARDALTIARRAAGESRTTTVPTI